MTIEVLTAGPLTTVQDAGRPGWADLGVTGSGAADRRSWATGNRLLANQDGAASLEMHVGLLSWRTDAAVAICVTGAPVPFTVAGRAEPMNAVVHVPAGATVTFGSAHGGLRSYVAFRGGLTVEPVLGSRSTDTLSGLGPLALTVGMRLPVGRPPWSLPLLDVAPVREPMATDPGRPVVLRLLRGPRDDWARDVDDLVRTRWQVGSHVDRVGLRLRSRTGFPAGLRRTHPGRELPSEGLVRGAVQLPPGEEPVLFLADHPVTGGYPVVAVVTDADTDLAAQLAPDRQVEFRWA